jgi:hypothetical protein
MMRTCRVLLCLALALFATPAWARNTARFALVIGNNRPLGVSARELRYADDDAVLTERLLRQAGVHTKLLVTLDADSRRSLGTVRSDGPARRGAIEQAYGELVKAMVAAQARGDAVEFILFYSGHGDVDRGQGFVVLEDERLSRSLLFALLSRSPEAHAKSCCVEHTPASPRTQASRRSRSCASFTPSRAAVVRTYRVVPVRLRARPAAAPATLAAERSLRA